MTPFTRGNDDAVKITPQNSLPPVSWRAAAALRYWLDDCQAFLYAGLAPIILGNQEVISCRPNFDDELGRAGSLCTAAPSRPGDGPARCFVAVRELPVERLVGAAFWRVVTETDGTRSAEFEWFMIESVAADEQTEFLKALVAEMSGQGEQAIRIASSAWLPPGHPLAAVLESVGFRVSGRRRLYCADASVWREALTDLSERQTLRSPAGEHFEALKTLLCGPSLRPSELAHGFLTAGGKSPALFDPRSSAVLEVDGKITAACLASVSHGHLTIAALSGTDEECARLLHHCLQSRDCLAATASLGFHLDDRVPLAALHKLAGQLPVMQSGTLHCYQQPISSGSLHRSRVIGMNRGHR